MNIFAMKPILLTLFFVITSLFSFAQKEPKQAAIPKANRQEQKPYIKKAEPKAKTESQAKSYKKPNDMPVKEQPKHTVKNPQTKKIDPKYQKHTTNNSGKNTG